MCWGWTALHALRQSLTLPGVHPLTAPQCHALGHTHTASRSLYREQRAHTSSWNLLDVSDVPTSWSATALHFLNRARWPHLSRRWCGWAEGRPHHLETDAGDTPPVRPDYARGCGDARPSVVPNRRNHRHHPLPAVIWTVAGWETRSTAWRRTRRVDVAKSQSHAVIRGASCTTRLSPLAAENRRSHRPAGDCAALRSPRPTPNDATTIMCIGDARGASVASPRRARPASPRSRYTCWLPAIGTGDAHVRAVGLLGGADGGGAARGAHSRGRTRGHQRLRAQRLHHLLSPV